MNPDLFSYDVELMSVCGPRSGFLNLADKRSTDSFHNAALLNET